MFVLYFLILFFLVIIIHHHHHTIHSLTHTHPLTTLLCVKSSYLPYITVYKLEMKVLLVHLDLGIGGAEMLVVNIACALLELGHDVKIYTSHHDESRCFEATRKGGTLYIINQFISHLNVLNNFVRKTCRMY